MFGLRKMEVARTEIVISTAYFLMADLPLLLAAA